MSTTATASGSVRASSAIVTPASTATQRSGRTREPTMSESCPTAILPRAPSTCVTATRAPAAAADQCRSLHQPGQGEGPHQELRHHQQHGDAVHPHQEPVGPVGVRGQGRGRGRAWRVEHDQEHGTERERHGRDRDPQRCLHARLGRRSPRSSLRPRRRRVAAPSGGSPWPARAAPAGTSPPRCDRWRSRCRPRTSPSRTGPRTAGPSASTVVATRGRGRAVPASPASSTARSPTRSTARPQRNRVTITPAIGIAATVPAWASDSPRLVLQRGDQERRTVDRHRGARLGGDAGAEHRPSPRSPDGGGIGVVSVTAPLIAVTPRRRRGGGSPRGRSRTPPPRGPRARRSPGSRRWWRCRRAECRCGPAPRPPPTRTPA